MKVRFWGTRGSIPVALTAAEVRAKLARALAGSIGRELSTPQAIDCYLDRLPFDISGTFGGNTSCVELETDAPHPVILDFGSGARALGLSMLARYGAKPQTYHIFMSHFHWDHIMGFPFFAPAYIPGNRLVVHSCHSEVENAFRQQYSVPYFPVKFEQLCAQIEFDVMQPGVRHEIAGYQVMARKQLHVGDSYGWRFEKAGKTLVYSTDSEHKLDNLAEVDSFVLFFRDADLVIFDAMFSLADAISAKADWGHSSNIVGIELCQLARARRLALFHHEPANSDSQIANMLAESRRFEEISRDTHQVEIIAAWDGLELEL